MASASAKSKSSHYDKAKKSFDLLEIEQRAKFLVEATAATLLEGVDRVSEVITTQCESMFQGMREEEADGAKKKTARKSTRKKAAAKKTSADESSDA